MATTVVVATVAVDDHHGDDCRVVATTVAVMAVAMMLMWLWLLQLMAVAVMTVAVKRERELVAIRRLLLTQCSTSFLYGYDGHSDERALVQRTNY